jgi:hypothetical protein
MPAGCSRPAVLSLDALCIMIDRPSGPPKCTMDVGRRPRRPHVVAQPTGTLRARADLSKSLLECGFSQEASQDGSEKRVLTTRPVVSLGHARLNPRS